MLIFALSLAMVASLATATVVSLHNESENARVKAVVRKTRTMR